MSFSRDKATKEDMVKAINYYLSEVLEVPRKEYEGLPACPFVKKERVNKKLMIDVFDHDNESFLDKIKVFTDSDYTDAVFAQHIGGEFNTRDSKDYQAFLNSLLSEHHNNYKVIVINPADSFEVEGFNPRSLAPCLLIVVTNRKKLSKAHEQMMNSKYFKNFGDDYLEHLHVKKEDLDLKD